MFEESEECPTAGYLTVFDGGRLGNQVLISSMFYTKHLHAQIPKAKKDILWLNWIFMLFGFLRANVACRTLTKSTPDEPVCDPLGTC